MSGAHPMMHSPRRANPWNSKHSVAPMETPTPRAGNRIVSRRNRFRSANRIAKMTNLASYFLASNGCEIESDPRHLRPDYRPLPLSLQGAVFAGRISILTATQPVADRVEPRLQVFAWAFLGNRLQKMR